MKLRKIQFFSELASLKFINYSFAYIDIFYFIITSIYVIFISEFPTNSQFSILSDSFTWQLNINTEEQKFTQKYCNKVWQNFFMRKQDNKKRNQSLEQNITQHNIQQFKNYRNTQQQKQTKKKNKLKKWDLKKQKKVQKQNFEEGQENN
ncbi:unnamed protein product (macronuclear) [Paramecium tetraurelia]|uniref:Transmembrane protein n=1 Tax=Paramecium tetraurelia TaxID=5888 RepID=A0BK40_PARTE|nr:uncharacterized protein GSPATT00029537001 [Paramecium tetraurelia]CAK58907.1 unnamed protein product [Paramecium tetraurelia]|eukprot:XP_001426305.1 hypothetical protein (macronuclear) [Paramecium tetraurelia strain d4-2]